MSGLKLKNFRVTSDFSGVVTVGIEVADRKFNVLTTEVFDELQTLLAHLEKDPAARLVVFRGAKETGFLAGADLKEINAMPDHASVQRFGIAGQDAFDHLERLRIPTVAVIYGPCLGGGLEFALACRYRIARDDGATQFGVPEVRLGLLPAWGGTQRLPELIGLDAALQMLWTGRKVSPRQALDLGLVDAIWPPDKFEDGVEQFIAERLKRGADCRSAESRSPRDKERKILDAARRRLLRGRHGPALAAILSAVEAGVHGNREAGIMKARDAFAELRFSEFGRRRLARYFSRSRAPRRAPSPALHSERKMQNESAIPWVAGLTIGAALRQTANRYADREAMVFTQAEVRKTWAEFDRRVDRVARGLLAIGMRRGDHFGVWSTNRPEWVILQFASARVGVVLVTITPSYARPLGFQPAMPSRSRTFAASRSSNAIGRLVILISCGKPVRKWIPPGPANFTAPSSRACSGWFACAARHSRECSPGKN